MNQRKIAPQLVAQVPLEFMELTADGSQPTVTGTAAALSALITAADATVTDFANINYIRINPEGTVRYLFKSTPTTLIGIELNDGDQIELVGINPTELMLISGGGVLINVQLGRVC